MPPPLRAVIFDLDDTLLDTTHAMQHALDHLSRQVIAFQNCPPGELLTAQQRIMLELDTEIFAGRLDAAQARTQRFELLLAEYGDTRTSGVAVAQLYRTAYTGAFREVAGAAQLMVTLRSRGLKIGVLTNYLREVQQASLDALTLTPYVDALITVSDAPPKPEPGAYAAMLDALGIPASAALMVGDSWVNDVLGAERAGMRAVWLNRTGLPRPAGSVGAAEIGRLDEVLGLL
jgi:putative hydrolase of the HAD superfamily